MLQFCSTCAAPPAGCTRNLNWCGAAPPELLAMKVIAVLVFCGLATVEVRAALVTGAAGGVLISAATNKSNVAPPHAPTKGSPDV